MAKTEHLELPLETHGTVALKQSFEAAMGILDGAVHELGIGSNAYSHAETEATSVKAALDDLFTRVAALEP